jgi:hypothetical protein
MIDKKYVQTMRSGLNGETYASRTCSIATGHRMRFADHEEEPILRANGVPP